MLLGYLRAVPKVDIHLDRESYSPGDELRFRITVTNKHPGLRVRSAVVEFVLENRYIHTAELPVLNLGSSGRSGGGEPGRPPRKLPSAATRRKRITKEMVDRTVLGREELFKDGVIRHRTEIFDFRFDVKAPAVLRTLERRASYMIHVRFDLPRMRDVKIRKVVPVELQF